MVGTTARYAVSSAAMLLSALAVQQASRAPPLKDVEIAIENLPPASKAIGFSN